MLQLEDHEVDMSNVNLRKEKHGDERKLGVDITIKFHAANRILDELESGLRESLFRPAGKGEQIDLVEGADGLVAVKFPRIGGLSWDEEFPGYELEIAGGLGLSEPLVLVDVTLKKFKFDPLEGGSVAITFSAVFHPDAEEAGTLCSLIQDEVDLTLVPPSKQEAEQLPEAA